MANLKETRRSLIWVATALLLLDVGAVAVLVSSLAGSGGARQREFDSVRHEVQSKLKTVIPPDQIQQRVGEADKQINTFYGDRLPSAMSVISKQLGDIAQQTGVRLTAVKYDTGESDLPGLEQVEIDANLAGNYVQEVKFINAMERQKLFFIVDGVTLVESEGGQVRLSVILQTFLRTGI